MRRCRRSPFHDCARIRPFRLRLPDSLPDAASIPQVRGRSGGPRHRRSVAAADATRDHSPRGVDVRRPEREVRCTLYQMQRAFELWATDMGAYHIDPQAGRIEMPETHDELMREQRLWGIPAALCCMHRGDLPLHAAAVEIASRAVLLAAPRWHGKTTLALAFQHRGYRVLTEDLACCSLASTPRLLPGPALLRVRPDVYHGHPPAGTPVVAARRTRVYLGMNDDSKGESTPPPF